MATIGAAGLAGVISPAHALGAAAYGVGLAAGTAVDHPRRNGIATHAAGIAEGILGGLAHGQVGHAATAAAAHLPSSGLAWRGILGQAAHVAGKVLPAVVAGVGFIDVTTTLDTAGPRALARTQDGRNGVINAIGGGLLLVPHPAAKLAGAGVMGLGIANDVGWLRGLDETSPSTTR